MDNFHDSIVGFEPISPREAGESWEQVCLAWLLGTYVCVPMYIHTYGAHTQAQPEAHRYAVRRMQACEMSQDGRSNVLILSVLLNCSRRFTLRGPRFLDCRAGIRPTGTFTRRLDAAAGQMPPSSPPSQPLPVHLVLLDKVSGEVPQWRHSCRRDSRLLRPSGDPRRPRANGASMAP